MRLIYIDSNSVEIINEIYLTQSTVEFSFIFNDLINNKEKRNIILKKRI